jgi:CubicO group peptidase (beta-lactamase class C family)
VKPNKTNLSELQARILEVLTAYNIPQAGVVLVRGDQSLLVYHHAEQHTQFNIASCGKAMLAELARRMVENGSIAWETPLKTLLPELELYSQAATNSLTLRQALSNCAGLAVRHPLEEGLGYTVSHDEMFSRLRYFAALGEFGKTYAYNNLLFVAAAEALARVAETPYALLLEQQLFLPLGMRHSHSWTRAPKAHRYANHEGAGWLYTTLPDTACWLRYLLQAPTPTPEVAVPLEQTGLWMSAGEPAFYGLGWAQSQFLGKALYGHSGATIGATAQMFYLPELALGLACYCAGGKLYRAALLYELIERLELGEVSRNWLALGDAERQRAVSGYAQAALEQCDQDTPDLPHQAYVGIYHSPVAGYAEVLHKQHLELHFADAPAWACLLEPRGGGVFAFHLKTPDFGLAFMEGAPCGQFLLQDGTVVGFKHLALGTLQKIVHATQV